jgi:isocitrate dehydrogenase
MKMTEGLLKRTFEEIAPEYPDITAQHIIVDNCAHQLVRRPEQFSVIVTTNMNGDILSDLTSALVGGLGFAPSANIGSDVAIFEAVHGSAPKYAGKDVINPTAMILSGVLMLRHIGAHAEADRLENAVLFTFEEGRHRTRDFAGDAGSCGTRAFTDAILGNLGKVPRHTPARTRSKLVLPVTSTAVDLVRPAKREVVGIDVFVESPLQPEVLGPKVQAAAEGTAFRLKMISNRGTVVFPLTGAKTDVVDQHRCRFVFQNPALDVGNAVVGALLSGIEQQGLRWMHIEKLQAFDDRPGFTKAQGED